MSEREVTFTGCRCGRVVIYRPTSAEITQPMMGIWCPSAEAGVHGWLMPYPYA